MRPDYESSVIDRGRGMGARSSGKNTDNCGIRHVTVPIATRILIANVRHIGVSNICVINLVYFKMQV